ncbi:SNF2 family N-terminal domain-containing protein [Aspergillus pseudoustus]|uniref:SNF2 family N-terminal domain-containing protein n=1 Tax=Aspergillus pseudoustus TaxID=1810923 RepID=A0ABR4KLZ4_9EURO
MDPQYVTIDSDGDDSALSTPRSWATPPSTPAQWSESAATTPESSSGYTRSYRQDSPFVGGRRLFLEWPVPRTQAENLEDISQRRSAFLQANQDLIQPLVGNALRNSQIGTTDSSVPLAIPYVLRGSQPSGLRANLKHYQLEGFSWLLYLKSNGVGGILGDDMGLGKTLQTLTVFQHMKDHESYRGHKFLVVCPLSVLNTWLSEIAKWTTGLTSMAYHGSANDRELLRKQFRQTISQPIDILITNYETLCGDLFFFQTITWSYIVLDEGHRIKNSQAKRTQGVYRLRAEYKLVLTGTPIQNDLTELWSILRWLYPEVFLPSTTQDFEEAFSLTKGACDSKFLDNLARFLALVMLRRTKGSPEIGLNIPEKKQTIISVPLTDLQLGLYYKILTGVERSVRLAPASELARTTNAIHASSAQEIEGLIDLTIDEWETDGAASSKRKGRISTNILMDLRKCSIHPYLLAGAISENYLPGHHVTQSSGKFIVLQKMIRQFVVVEKRKVIIFSGFDQALNLCEDLLQLEKAHAPFSHVRLDGSTTSAWRNLSVFLFSNEPRCKVFLLSIRAGGEGLNLVSSSTVIFLDDDWNPQIMRQAEARVHRLGQTEPVNIFRLHSRGTVEDQMRRRLSKKAYLSDKVMETSSDNDGCSPMDLNFQGSQELALSSINSVLGNPLDVKDLLSSDLYTILHSCAVGEENGLEMSRAEKQTWLERAERVRTNIFNGEQVDTSSRSFSAYEETVIGVSRASRRIGKSRVVTMGEWVVSKESIETASKLNTPTKPKPKAAAEVSKINQKICFLCRRLNPIECKTCTRAYHKACLDMRDDFEYTPKRNAIVCPHHHCCDCGKPASQVGRLLFACLRCPSAYCEHCLDWNQTTFIGNDSEGESRGYFPTSAYYIVCAPCRVPVRKRKLDVMEMDAAKRIRHC